MIVSLLLVCASAPCTSPAALAEAPSVARAVRLAPQDEDERPDKRPEVKELLKRLSELASKRGKEDTEGVGVIDKLTKEFPDSGAKDREAIAKGVAKCLSEKRTETDGVFDNKLYLAAATALGEMGPESAKALMGWIDHKTLRKDMAVQRQLILSLGKTRDPKAIKTLMDLVKHKEPTMQGAAAEALGNYKDEPQDVRKEIFEEILKELTAVKGQVDADIGLADTITRERYDVIAAPMVTTLRELSGHEERDPAEWQHWWNKNKKENWDEET